MLRLSQKGVVHIFALFILVIGLIAGVYLATHPTFFKPKASGGNNLQIVDANGNEFPNNTTDNPNVRLKINLPDGWVVNSSNQGEGAMLNNFSFVKTVYAEGACKSDCLSCETQNTCGYTTYDTCTDDRGQTGSDLCSNGATKFGCQAGSNSNCQSGNMEYSCANSAQCSDKAIINTRLNDLKISIESDCKADCSKCKVVSTCGYTTYDNCKDDQGYSGADLCKHGASKFGCQALDNDNCQSGNLEYNCSNSPQCSNTGNIQPQIKQTDKHIIQKVIVENKDTDGSSGGLSPQEIPLEKLNTLIPWELEHLQPNQPQAQRHVQVTLFDGKEYRALPANITLTKKAAIQKREITIEDDSNQDLESGSDYENWVTQMHSFGIYPAKEGGEIILYNRKQFVEKYCQPQGCYLNTPPINETLDAVKSDAKFIKDLGVRLKEAGFAPLTVLKPYFPDIINIDKSVYLQLEALEPICREEPEGLVCRPGDDQYKREISIEELKKIIDRPFIEAALSEKNPLKRFITTTDPIFGIRSLINVLSLPPNEVSDEERINALLGLTMVYGLTEKVTLGGFRIVENASVPMVNMIKDIKIIRLSIANGEAYQLSNLPFDPGIRGNWLQRLIKLVKPVKLGNNGFLVIGRQRTWVNQDRLFPTRAQFPPGEGLMRAGEIPAPSIAHLRFLQEIQPLIRSGEGYVVSRSDVLVPVRTNIIRAIGNFQYQIGRNIGVNSANLDRLVEQGTAYVLKNDNDFKFPGIAGYAYQDMIVMKGSDYLSYYGVHAIHHESIHIISFSNGWARGWTYGGVTEEDKVISAIVELGTEFWTDLSIGQVPGSRQGLSITGGYHSKYNGLYNLLAKAINSNRSAYEDILEFTLNPDKNILYKHFSRGYQELADFLRSNGINPQALAIIPAASEFLNSQGDDKNNFSIEPIIDIQDGFDKPE